MTDVPIRVRITSDQAVQGKEVVVRSLKDIRAAAANNNQELGKLGPTVRKGAKEAVTGVDLLKRALIALGGIAIVRQILQLGNAFSELRNRVLLAVDSVDQANATLDRLFDIANRNRAPIEELTALFQKASIASAELGANQEELFTFVELVARGLAIQGGAANTARGALLQLSQALGSGIVRAEEFNSILEGAFPIAQAAARGIDRAGGSVARLRQLVLDGQITSRDFFEGLLSQADELEATFARINPTIASASIVFRNTVIKILGESEGVFGLIARAILVVADNLELLIKLATVAGAALLAAFAPAILGAAIAKITLAVNALTIAIAANPIGALAVAITAATTALVVFSDEIKLSNDGLATLSDLIDVFVEDVADAFNELKGFFSEVFGPLINLVEDTFGQIEFSIAGVLRFTANIIDRWIGLWRGAFMAVVAIWENLPAAFEDIFTQALNGAIALVEDGVNAITEALNVLPGVDIGQSNLGRIGNDAAGSASEFGSKIADAFSEGFNQDTIADNIDRALERAENKAKERLKNVGQDALTAANDNTLTTPITDMIKKTKTELNDFGKTFESIMGSMEDSLVEFVRTGKFNFSDLVNSILDDLARLAVRQFVTQPLSNAISGLAGSLFTSGAGGAAGASSAAAGSGFFSSIGGFFGFDQGVDFVPRDMVAQLHRGERVVSAADNRNNTAGNNNSQPITVNMVMPNVTDFQSFRQNQGNATASIARTLQQSMRRNN